MARNLTETQLATLFLQQSLADSEADYNRTLTDPGFPHYDVIAITASNEHQAEAFRHQLAIRDLPKHTEFVVIPDKEGKRVGSGGATLSVIKYVREKYGSFKGLNIACLHSGGDGKRTPTYSALGKLFSPVPRMLPSGRPSTLFDEFMISIASVPGRMRGGMLLLSGDVLLLFNPLQIDYSGKGAAAISFKEDVETGKDHGVFLKGNDGYVRQFLHKQSVERLTEMGAVNASQKVAIDTGAVIFGPDMLEDLYHLVDSKEKEDRFINPIVRLSLYGDFLYPLADDSTLEKFYLEQPEGEFCDELLRARKEVWDILSPYRMKLLNLAPAKFIHFGTTREVLALMDHGVEEYSQLGWSRKINSSIGGDTAGYCSVLSDKASVGEGCYLEVSHVHRGARIGNRCVLSYVNIHEENVPDQAVLHGLKQSNGKFVCRIYGVQDNPKTDVFFGTPLTEKLINAGISKENIWSEGDAVNLWNAKLYPECDTPDEAVKAALATYALLKEGGDPVQWIQKSRKSLCSGFNDADSEAIIEWTERMGEIVQMDEIAGLIRNGRPAREAGSILKKDHLTKVQREWLEHEFNLLNMQELSDFGYGMRLYYYLGIALGSDTYVAKAFSAIADTILKATMKGLEYKSGLRIEKENVTISLPLRVNWGGGWSDTAPHCLENGGMVLNAAISLNGELPVEVKIHRIPDRKIVFDSRDMDVHGEFETLAPLQNTGDPFDPFALQKACLLACGVIPKKGDKEYRNGTLQDILARLGGGFEMHSEVTNVPKGSGLGTSSILSAACVKAIFEFFGLHYSEDDLYSTVLAMEQIMSTGGGWQDQVGGVTNGIKLVTSEPGINQQIKVEHIELSEETKKELRERYCLIYTGQRRLARNLLRDVVGRYVGKEEESLTAHQEIQKTAMLMKSALLNDSIDEFARLLDRHWTLNRMIDAGSSNTLIDQIFLSIEDLIDARMVCGAGGGGFLQVILKKNVTKEDVHERLKEVFQDFEVDVWNAEIVY